MSAALRIELSFVNHKLSPLEQLTPLLPHLVEAARVYMDLVRPKAARATASSPFSFDFGSSTHQDEPSTPQEQADPLGWLWRNMSNPEELSRALRLMRTLNPEMYASIRHAMMEPDEEDMGTSDTDAEGLDADGGAPDQDGDGDGEE